MNTNTWDTETGTLSKLNLEYETAERAEDAYQYGHGPSISSQGTPGMKPRLRRLSLFLRSSAFGHCVIPAIESPAQRVGAARKSVFGKLAYDLQIRPQVA